MALCVLEKDGIGDVAPEFIYRAKVIEVLDGDSFKAQVDLGFNVFIKETFRIFGVDTPETRTTDQEEKERGNEAKQYVKDAIEGEEVVVVSEKREKFGRYLATVIYGGKNLNKELVEKGLAKEYFGGKR